ncbi:MAG: hypothetical protein FJW40_10320 [Acidobacteria bacterium]|nr:hypothetical protein [Acidobacteriota bacterium]
MKRRLALLSAALAAAVAWASFELHSRWREAETRRQEVLSRRVASAKAGEFAAPPAPQPVTGAEYLEVAQKTLFSKDRNPNVVVELPAPKPTPPLPVVHGVMDIGDGPTVFLSDRSRGGQQHAVRAGGKIGDLTLVSLSETEIVFQFEGVDIKKPIAELRYKEPGPQAGQAAAAAPVAAASTTNLTPAAPATPGPGQAMTGTDKKYCQAGETSAPGTVVGGYKKVVTATPFGQACFWEAVK